MLACEGVAAGPRSPWSAPPTAATAGAGPRAAGEAVPAGTAAGRAASTTAAPGADPGDMADRLSPASGCAAPAATGCSWASGLHERGAEAGTASPWSEAPRSDTPGRGPAGAEALARSVSRARLASGAPTRTPRIGRAPRITAAPGVFTGARVVTVCGSCWLPGVVSARTPRPDAGSVAARAEGSRSAGSEARAAGEAAAARSGVTFPDGAATAVAPSVPVTPDTGTAGVAATTGPCAAVGGGGGGQVPVVGGAWPGRRSRQRHRRS